LIDPNNLEKKSQIQKELDQVGKSPTKTINNYIRDLTDERQKFFIEIQSEINSYRLDS